MAVDPLGAAADAGIRQGDVIEQVNQQAVRYVTDLIAALDRTGQQASATVVNHRGRTVFVTIRPR
jgi:S1-C subfamily serine protease